MTNEKEKQIKQIKELVQFLPEKKQEDLAQILEYGEEIKAKGEEKKQEFWEIHTRDDFSKLLNYKWKHENELLGKYQYWESMKGLEREKFIEEYLYDDMLYSIDIQKCPEKKAGREYSYEDWKNGNVVIEEGVWLLLYNNQIGDVGAEAIAKYLKLKEGVYLRLDNNQIGDDGAEAIANNLQLKEGVFLDLYNNQIGDDGAEAIMGNMKLKNGVTLDLCVNNISKDVAQRLKDWEKSYHDKGINCTVLV